MRTHQLRALVLGSIAVLQVGASLAPSPLEGQVDSAHPIFLAMPDAYPDVDGRVMLLREPGREIVVVAEAVTPEDLTMAFRMLERFRRERGHPEGGRGHMVPIVGYAPPPVLSAEERTRLDGVLADLRARPLANVGSLGRGRWMRYDAR